MKRSLALVAAVALVAGCSGDTSTRRDVIDAYRRELVREGVHDGQARCLTTKFFAELSDAQLREFQKRDALTDAERARFAQLAGECPDDA